MPDQSGISPPYLDPSQYPAYLDMQRKQMLAQMLMQNSQAANQTPGDWDSMKVVPRRGMLSNISGALGSFLAGKAMKGSQQAQTKYFQGLYGGDQGQSQTGAPPAAAPSEAPAPPPMLAAPPGQDPGPQASAQPVPSSSNPMIPPGMSRGTAQMLMGMLGPQGYAEKVMVPNAMGTTEWQNALRASRGDPDKAVSLLRMAAMKNGSVEIRGGSTAGSFNDQGNFVPNFTAPQNGINTTWGPNGPTSSTIKGAPEAAQAAAAATTAGTESQKPIKVGTDANGQDIFRYPTPPAALAAATNAAPQSGSAGAPPSAAAPRNYFPGIGAGQTASGAVLQAQKTGAEQGQQYAGELAKNATGATEVRRSLSELKNLSRQATPGAMNEGKMKLGSYMIAAGIDPQTTANWLGVNIGALQAAQKQTATLAVNTIHSMTSRGTNFDLETFMRNNPNMNMSDPSAFNKVVDYMDNKSRQEIAKQKDFAQWKAGKSPDEWETGHTAHWLDQQNQDIDAGKSNSRPPLSSFVRP